MAVLKSGTTIGGSAAIHAGNMADHGIITTSNIGSYALTSVPANVITTGGGQTIGGTTYFSASESLNLYGIRGRFTNEYIHLYNKVGIGHPSGWGQGEGNTPAYGLSTYGGINVGYGYDGQAVFNTYTRINYNWGGGTYGTEAFTIRGTYPSITLRSTTHDNKWLIHNASNLQYYYGASVDNNDWGKKIEFATDGNIWSAYYSDWYSNVFMRKNTWEGNSYIGTSGAFYGTIFYDSNNTSYYGDFAGTSNLNVLYTNYLHINGTELTGTQAQLLKNTLDVTTLPYKVDITVNGDANTFYAVQFWGGDQDVWRRIIIKRGYGETAPWDPIGTGVHHGGLLLDWEGNFGGWGGAEYADRIRVFNESYTNVCADMFIYSHSMGYVFMLRGGGAVYHLFSDQPINGFYQSGAPDILYSTSTLSYDDTWSGTNQYDVPAPAPLTLAQVNSSRIDGLRTKKQSLLDNRYFRQGVDISGVTNITSTNFLATNAFYLNSYNYYLNSNNGGIYTNARFETAGNLHVSGSSQFNGNAQWFSGTSAIGLENQTTFARFAFNKLTFWDWNNGYDVMTIDDGYVSSATSFRAPIFYDSNDTGYYLDPNGTSNLSRLLVPNASSGASLIVGTNNTSRVYNDDARKGLVVNADYYPHIYVNALSSASNNVHGAVISMTGTLSAGGYRRWGMGIANTDPSALSWGWWDNDSNPHYSVGGTLGYTATGARMWLNTDGVLQTTGSMRAPIFYDSEDTGYYVDPNSTSNINAMNMAGTLAMYGGAYYGTITFGTSSYWRCGISQRDAANAEMRIWAKGGTSGSIYFATGHDGESSVATLPTDGMALKNNSLGLGSWAAGEFPSHKLHVKGTGYATSDFRAPIFYDSADTSYYLDPASGSYLYGLQLSGNAYFRPNSWVQLDGNYGVYWPNHYGLHIYPNNDGSYGSLQVKGSKNSWHGIHFDSGATLMMNSNESGVHRQGYGWQFRWSSGEMYISANTYGGGTERTVIHSGNIGSQSVSYASSAGNADTVDSLHASSFVRRDTTGQFLKPYQEYGSYISNSTLPNELVSNMGGGGLRVDFLNSASFGSWAHTITFSGYNGYNMYQLAGHYKGSGGEGPDLYVRCEPNHGQNSWSSWQKLWHTGHFTDTNISNWNTAYGWGNHANYGYLTSLPSHNHDDRYYTEGESLDLFARRDTNTNINGNLVLGNTAYNQSTAYGNSGAKLFFNGSDSDAQGNYYIGTNHEDYGGNYSKLDLRWHTGIRIGAQPNYGGVRFYNNEDLGTVIFSVGTGDANVRVANSLYVDGSFSVQSGQSIYLSTSADTNWRIGRNLVTESDNSLTGSTMQFIAANVSDQGWQFVNSAGKTIVEISSYTNGGLFVINQKEFWLKQPIGGRLTTIRKKVTDGLSPNNVKIADTSLAAYSANGNPNTYIIIQTLVPQDEYQMGGFTIDLFARYGDTNGKTKIDLGGYWNPEGNGGFTGWEAHGTNPQLKPTIQVGRNVNSGMTAIILSGITWEYPVVVARDLYLGYNSADGAAYGFGWHIYSSPNINDFTNLDTVVWRNAYSDSNPAGYITASANTASASVLATARTLTIGSTGKAFNGSADVSWSLAEIGAQPAGSYLTSLGFSYSTGVNANHVVQRDANGYIYANHINFSTGEAENPTINSFITSNGDGWSRKSSLAHVKNSIRGVADGTWSISITGDAGSVDGVDSSAIVYGGTGRASNYVDSMNDPNQKSGFFYKDSPTGQPFGDWWNWLNVAGNSWQSSNNYSFQISHAFHSDDAYIRRVTNGTVYSWRTLITSGNIGSQSVSYATSAGSATSATNATNANRLERYTIFYGNDWNTAGVDNRLIASSFHNATGPNKPPVYTYGGMLSYMNSGADNWQIAIPENQNSAVGKFNSMHYRSGWNGVWSSWRQVLDFTDGLCAIDAPGTVTTRVYSSASGYNTPFASNLEIWGQVDDWAYGKFRFRVQDDPASQPVYGAQFRIERFSVNSGWELLGMVPRASQNLEWQGDIMPGLSDGRVKENVTTLTKGLETVKDINAVEFDWIPTAGVSERTGHDIGFIAQELEEIIPEAVYTRTDGYKTVRYEKVVPVLVQAIKDQQSIIDSLISRIEALENK